MEIVYFTLGLLTGIIITIITLIAIAIKLAYTPDKGDNQECTNQEQQ